MIVKVGITGSRFKKKNGKQFPFSVPEWLLEKYLKSVHKFFPTCTEIIFVHGGAIGFDTCVQKYAEKNDIKTIIIRPDGEQGQDRNNIIVEISDCLLAVKAQLSNAGTEYTTTKAKIAGIPVFEFLNMY